MRDWRNDEIDHMCHLTLMEIHIWNPSEKMVVKEQVRQMRERERERVN